MFPELPVTSLSIRSQYLCFYGGGTVEVQSGKQVIRFDIWLWPSVSYQVEEDKWESVPFNEIVGIDKEDLEVLVSCGKPVVAGPMVLQAECYKQPNAKPIFTINRITCDPDPKPPGEWRKYVKGRFPMKYRKIARPNFWEKIGEDAAL